MTTARTGRLRMPLQQLVLSAGAAFALASLLTIAAQTAGPDELWSRATSARARMAGTAALARAGPVERRIEMLREQLLMDAARAPAEWGRLAMVLRANAELVEAVTARWPSGRDAPTLDVVRAQAEIAAARAEALRDLLPALQSLYRVLTPEQRRAADRVFRAGPLAGGTPG